MSKPLLRIPYTGPLPPPLIIPPSAATRHGAVAALTKFLTDNAFSNNNSSSSSSNSRKTVLLTGAGLSTASGLADYRGTNGTYTQNKTYRPIYFHEFVASHESRKRYWARSFLGWRGLNRSQPNAGHKAIRDLWQLGLVSSVVTQNVDSFHNMAHRGLRTIELHGYLRRLVCLSCRHEMDRDAFQARLAQLNPAWSAFLQDLLRSGALDTENPTERRQKGFKTNPDGDADVPGAPYTTFRYPACPTCLKRPPILPDGAKAHVVVDRDGAWLPESGPTGVLKPNVIMFGESIPQATKTAAEEAIDGAAKLLVVGSSLATYSAWRLAKRALDRNMPIAILNIGGVRKEDAFFEGVERAQTPSGAVRVSMAAEDILPGVVELVRRNRARM
ncbi:uncharacterized protein A1O9_04402 [Exophiala aquamarina CBS 119918]|uniref:Deacetylase sirtuin-type domain-containing protein n=1 Tax=Exophiala aquamarina CBS 119918 TaxID=1182545 RepID=A0A072PIH4_9EURO|nr:uncharacterized protein A1O9_04402 [Exophiala aquamarina CBS 119918]KEF59557.1 hypothetical protein A1O9_04402 [Exophiala aquamarina CBS 119918]